MSQTLLFTKKDPNAIMPTKAYPDDVGYDLTAISVVSQKSTRTIMYDTGITVSPPDGYYTEIQARSSIFKIGCMVANSSGIIDPSYTGTLKIVLVKTDPDLPTPDLPFSVCQLVLKKQHVPDYLGYVDGTYCSDQTDNGEGKCTSSRGEGGFGSTNNL